MTPGATAPKAAAPVAPAQATRRASRLGVGAVIAATVCWSFGGVLGKSVDANGLVIAFWRLWMGALLFNAALYLKGRRLSWRILRLAGVGGVLFAANIAVFFSAIRHTSIANVAIIGALTPVAIMVPAARWMGEKLRPITVVCAAIAVLGVCAAVLIGGSAGVARSWAGDGMAVLSLLFWIAYLLVTKRQRTHLDALEYLAASVLIAAITTTVVAAATGNMTPVHGDDWLWLILLALIPGALGHGLLTWAHAHVDVSISSVLIQGEPVGQTLTAALFLGEAVSFTQGLIMAVVIGALGVLALKTS